MSEKSAKKPTAKKGKGKPVEKKEAGLRFQCEPDCGACCRNPGDVFLTRNEIKLLAAHLGVSLYKLKRTVVRKNDGGQWMIDDPQESPCRFLAGDACSIYDVRPFQCRSFPFWPEIVRSPAKWRALKKQCPGIDRGPLHTVEEIARTLRAVELDRLFP